jgi:hypothetical protein
MSCQELEEWIALEVGGDLGANEAANLGMHLNECEACSRFAEELQASQASLRALHSAALPEDRLAAVRSAVLNELGEKAAPSTLAWEGLSSPTGLRPRLALAGLAAVLLLAVSFWSLNRPGPVEKSPVVASILPIESPTPEDRVNPEEHVAEELPIETANTPHVHDVNPTQHQKVIREATPPVEPSFIEEKPTQPAADPEIEVVSMPDAAADDPNANPDVVLRLASNNPDITIYWLVGENGD